MAPTRVHAHRVTIAATTLEELLQLALITCLEIGHNTCINLALKSFLKVLFKSNKKYLTPFLS